LGQARSLFAEKQPAAVPELGVGIIPGRFGRGKPQVWSRIAGEEIIQAGINGEVHHGPVIQAGASDSLLADVKAQGLDEVQTAPGGGAGAGDIPAVLGDLRFYQYNIYHSFLSSHISTVIIDRQTGNYKEKLGKFAKLFNFSENFVSGQRPDLMIKCYTVIKWKNLWEGSTEWTGRNCAWWSK
jgi:hypothetical protein